MTGVWLHSSACFVLTIVTTTLAGASHYASFSLGLPAPIADLAAR